MVRPEDLIAFSDEESVPAGLDLVVAMHGFADAGAAAELAAATIVSTLPHTSVVEFDTDLLVDHRSRRPHILFDEDHIEEYVPHALTLSLCEDDAGKPFLLLSGPEPDWMWERFADAVRTVAERLHVAATTIVLSIPMPVPHTRPLGVTVSGNRKDLVEAFSVWKPTSTVPASVMHLLEHRLAPEMPVASFVVLVPHYVGESGTAGPALAALDGVTNATGLVFRTEELRGTEREFQSLVAQQMETNEELQRLVATLEARYDAYMENAGVRSPLTDEDGSLPTADEIAAELERYLARRRADPTQP
ncbi:PAC2 family protein [Agrococcus jejuensis]|uniref:PAC2 family protein n=1 Tax=Agrococcus jejuensis TaxID=399736 RepID=A0A1G7ZW14_9MICO|nr:PAC2 family protein [Agrococcus jejuensis]SDH12854.1 PAC2 family protein [Agrococcus jejuensis]